MRAAALLLPLLLALPALADAPAPRGRVVVEGASVTLGDLFENAGPRADTTLGPAPAPGRTIVIEAPQLHAIARDFGVTWRPMTGGERVVLERPGRPLPREAVTDLLRDELTPLGAEPELDFEIAGFQPLVLPASAGEPQLALDQPAYDAASRRFSATLMVVAEGMPTQRIPLSGRMVLMRDAVVATRALRRDEVIRPGDVQRERIRADRLRAGVAEREELVVGARLRRPIPAGQPVATGDVVAVPVIAKDTPVILVHEIPGMSLSAQGRAQEDGARGALIPVLNLSNGSVVMAEVLGPGRARAMGALPDRNRQRAAAR